MAGWLTVFAEEDDEQQVDHMHGGPNGVYVCVLCACQWMHDPVCCPLVTESPFQVTVAIHVPPLLTGPARRCQSCLSVSQSARPLSAGTRVRYLFFFFFFFCVNTTVSKCHRAEDIHIHTHTHTHTYTHTRTMPACSSAERSTHRAGKQRLHKHHRAPRGRVARLIVRVEEHAVLKEERRMIE
jgi:hypothetical protein